MKLIRVIAVAALFQGCFEPIDVGFNDAGTRDAGSGCDGERLLCAPGSAGGLCGDGQSQANCVGDAWVCPSGTIPSSLCACTGTRPGCTCTSQGWSCPVTDGGACELGRDQMCNAVPAMSSFAGSCVNGACVCNSGFTLTSFGKCAPIASYCIVSTASRCHYELPDGGALPPATCDGQTATGCTCGADDAGVTVVRCTGACPPSQSMCIVTNCGGVNCLPPLRCVAPGVCQQ